MPPKYCPFAQSICETGVIKIQCMKQSDLTIVSHPPSFTMVIEDRYCIFWSDNLSDCTLKPPYKGV